MSHYEPAGDYSETVLYTGITTANGAVNGTTLIDSTLIASNDFLTDVTIIIKSGVCNHETREILSFTSVSGTITVGTAFSAQIVSGVSFSIIGRLTGDYEVNVLQANIGDFQAQTNLRSLLASLGIPDVAGKDLYTCLITDRLDNATYGLSALETLVDGLESDVTIIKADTQTIEDSTLKSDPTAGSLARFIASGGTALGTQLPASKSLYDCLSGGVTTVDRIVGKPQIIEVIVTIAANAAATTIATITTQPCLIKSIVVHADAAQTADLTSLNVKGGASNVVTFIDDGTGAAANFDAADKQVAWTGAVRLAATKTITIDPTGTGGTALDLTVTIEYEACVAGGYLV